MVEVSFEVCFRASELSKRLPCSLFPQDPRQQTLFSFVESFVEDYADDKSSKLVESVASTSSNSNSKSEINAKAETLETTKFKDVKTVSGSDVRKRKPEFDALETGSEISSALEDNFDWCDGIEDEHFISGEFQKDIVNCNNGPGPSAKRYRR